jgi:hypothetical protein
MGVCMCVRACVGATLCVAYSPPPTNTCHHSHHPPTHTHTHTHSHPLPHSPFSHTLTHPPTHTHTHTHTQRPKKDRSRAALKGAKRRSDAVRYQALVARAVEHIQVGLHAYIHTHGHACMHAYIHTYIHTDVHACIHKYIQTCMHTYVQTCMHACIHTYVHAYIRADVHACMHTYVHAHIAYIHASTPT